MSLPVWSWNETEEKTVLLSVQHLEGQVSFLSLYDCILKPAPAETTADK